MFRMGVATLVLVVLCGIAALIKWWPTPQIVTESNQGGASSAGAADANAPTFRHLRFGVDVRVKIPQCSPTTASKTCWTDYDSQIIFYDSISEESYRYDAHWMQVNGKLAAIRFIYPVGDFPELENLFDAKYGKPTSSEEQEWQSKLGVCIKARVRVWKWRGLTITLRAPADDVNDGEGSVATQEYLDGLEKARLERQQRNLRDL